LQYPYVIGSLDVHSNLSYCWW